MRIYLEEPEWRQVLAILAQAPWQVANPLIMKIGEQMRQADPLPQGEARKPDGEDRPRHEPH